MNFTFNNAKTMENDDYKLGLDEKEWQEIEDVGKGAEAIVTKAIIYINKATNSN